jgi:hypothetical protein
MDGKARVVCCLLMLLVAPAACGSSEELGPSEDLVITRISQPGFSGFETPQRLVIRTGPAWQEAWQTLWRRAPEPPQLPAVDFGRDMVILAAAGVKPTTGYFIAIEAATANRREVTVRVRSIAPGANCVNATVLTQPVEVVRIEARERVVFDEVSEVRNCG